MRGKMSALLGSALLGGLCLLTPASASACGGTFCDQGPPGQPPMPVDQTGENVLFVMAAGQVEAHIQIQYSGDPERFAWVIPVPKKPELKVGSQLLFQRMLQATVPVFTLNTTANICTSQGAGSPDSTGGGFGCAAAASDDDSGSSFSPGPNGQSGTDSSAPEIRLRQSVGAFEAVVLEPSNTQSMLDWLEGNGFDTDREESEPIIQDYINRGHLFVAIKLRPAAGADEIHPLVIRYPGTEPCVPLKLTGVAASENMAVRTFFLGERRVVPTNFKHVTLNPARLDFRALGQNYNVAVARAVDEPGADGRAFVTEYAGPSAVVTDDGLYQASWSNADFSTEDVQGAVDELTRLGLLQCSSALSCTAPHPLVFPLLARHITPPEGVTPEAYYSCVSCYPEPQAPAEPWNAQAFDTDFQELIAEPAKRASEVLTTYPYLTRMLTRISPDEMTADPMFSEWAEELPDVTASLAATQALRCDASWETRLPDSRKVVGGSAGNTPALPNELPWAETIEEFSESGQHLVLIDNAERIDNVLDAFNEPEVVSDSIDPSSRNQSSGCGCRLVQGGNGYGTGAFGLLVGLVLRRRRRQRRRDLASSWFGR